MNSYSLASMYLRVTKTMTIWLTVSIGSLRNPRPWVFILTLWLPLHSIRTACQTHGETDKASQTLTLINSNSSSKSLSVNHKAKAKLASDRTSPTSLNGKRGVLIILTILTITRTTVLANLILLIKAILPSLVRDHKERSVVEGTMQLVRLGPHNNKITINHLQLSLKIPQFIM